MLSDQCSLMQDFKQGLILVKRHKVLLLLCGKSPTECREAVAQMEMGKDKSCQSPSLTQAHVQEAKKPHN